MDPKETARIGVFAAGFSIVFCQLLLSVLGQHAHLSRAQATGGLAICLAGVVVGLLFVLCVSAFQEAGSGWDRPLGAVGLALGCALLLALVVRHTPHAESTLSSAQASSRQNH